MTLAVPIHSWGAMILDEPDPMCKSSVIEIDKAGWETGKQKAS